MALGEFTKQLAQQAILNATSSTKETKEPAASQPDSAGAVILGQIAAMQKALKDDEELALYFQSGPDRIRVTEIFLPAPRVAVLSGIDQDRRRARAISAVDALQLVVKVAKAQAGAQPLRVGLIQPK